MPGVPDREKSLRWMFLALGWLLFTCHSFISFTLLHADNLATALYPDDLRSQLLFLSAVALWFAVVIFHCFVTAWGLKRQRPWARRTGIIASAFLLLGLPWLTLVGALGLYLLLSQPRQKPAPRLPEDFWMPGRQSLFGIVASGIAFIAAMQCLSIFEKYAQVMGLPDLDFLKSNLGNALTFFALLPFGLFLHLLLHESGHALAAWSVGFRVKALNVGPLTVCRDNHGYHFSWEWQRLLSGGYVGAVPASEEGVWAKQIFVVAAGPLTSLAVALAATWAFFQLSGTSLAPFWLSFALISLLGYYTAAVNLLPAGYTDGTMLFHLILCTARGKELVARILSGQAHEDANERRTAGDHESTLTLRRAALNRLVEGGGHHPLELAIAHSELGLAELVAGSRRVAEASFRSSLEVLANNGGNPAVEADCWIGLHRVYCLQQRPAGAAEAYQAAWQALVHLREKPPAGIDRLSVQAGLAELHSSAGAFEPALAVIGNVLPSLSGSPKHRRLRGLLLRFRARCELQLGHPERGLATVEEAATLCRTVGRSARAEAPQEIGLLAEVLWNGGQTEPAIALLTECIGLFEQRGEPNPAARFRLLLAEVLWRDGRISDAEKALPEPANLGDKLRSLFLQERAPIHQKAGRLEESLADYREVLRLEEAGPDSVEIPIAIAQSNLAEVLLDAGNLDEAESLVHEAWRELSAVNHPDAAGASVTLALISWRKKRTTYAWLDQALHRIDEAPLVLHANKARFLESAAVRLEKDGLLEEADRFRLAAEPHWQSLGLSSKSSHSLAPA